MEYTKWMNFFSSWVESPSLFGQDKGKGRKRGRVGEWGERKEVQGVSNQEDLTHMDEN
jgi:hypothetical protein